MRNASSAYCEQVGVNRHDGGVKAVHHIHVWAISTTENALTAHVVLESLSCMEEVKHDLKDLLNHAGIPHATLEFESVAERCDDLHD